MRFAHLRCAMARAQRPTLHAHVRSSRCSAHVSRALHCPIRGVRTCPNIPPYILALILTKAYYYWQFAHTFSNFIESCFALFRFVWNELISERLPRVLPGRKPTTSSCRVSCDSDRKSFDTQRTDDRGKSWVAVRYLLVPYLPRPMVVESSSAGSSRARLRDSPTPLDLYCLESRMHYLPVPLFRVL